MNTPVLKVSGTSRSAKVAGAIAGMIREKNEVDVQAMGVLAVNQAVKAIALACSFLKENEIEAVFLPEFVELDIEDQRRTAIRFKVQKR